MQVKDHVALTLLTSDFIFFQFSKIAIAGKLHWIDEAFHSMDLDEICRI